MPPLPRPIVAPGPWRELLATIERGTVLVVGATDTGKSSLARYLVSQLDRPLDRVALVDADPGQKSVGVPACLGLAVTGPWEAPAALWFVGDVSPVGNLLPIVVGTARLAQRARESGAEAVVINTSGLVEGPAARALKLHMAVASGVDQVVAIQRDGELEPLLELLEEPGRSIHRLAPVADLRVRSPVERRRHREARFQAHFRGAEVRWFGRRKLVGAGWNPGAAAGLAPGTVVGLLAEGGFCLALGLLEELGEDRAAVLTPWKDPRVVVRLKAGGLRLDRSSWPSD